MLAVPTLDCDLGDNSDLPRPDWLSFSSVHPSGGPTLHTEGVGKEGGGCGYWPKYDK